MRLLFRDQLRKIKIHWINFISLSLLVIAISMTYTAVTSSIRRLEDNYEPYLEAQQLEDFYFSMRDVDVNAISGQALWRLCQELSLEYECGVAISMGDPVSYNHLNVLINQEIKDQPDVYETLIDQYAEQFIEEYDYSYEKSYVADITQGDFVYKFVSTTERINLPYLLDGELPDDLFEIAIFPEFAEANDLAIGDSINIRGKDYNITGFMYKVEFLFPIFSLQTIQFDPSTQTLVLATKETMEELDEYLFTKYLIEGDLDAAFPDFGYTNIQSNDFSVLGRQTAMIYMLMPADINFRIIALEMEIDNANAFIGVFLPLFVAMIGLLLLIFMKRYIEQNKADLKVLRALGYSDTELSLVLMLYPTLVACTSLIGYGLGLLLSNQLFDTYSARYLFPKAGFQLYPDLLLYAVVFPVLFLLITNFLFIRHSLKPKRPRHPHRWLRWNKFVETRTILYTGLLFLTLSVMLLFGLSGNTMFTGFVDYTKTGNHYEEMIHLQYMTNEDHLDSYETYTKLQVFIQGVNSRGLKTVQSTTLYGITPQTTLKRLINDDVENNELLRDGVIVSDFLYTTLGLDIGDSLSLQIGGIDYETVVVGVSNELLENNLYMDKATLNQLFDLDESYYNGIFATDYNYQSPYILSRIDYVNSLEEFSAILNISSLIINYLVLLSMALSLFIFTLVLINYFVDHKIDIAILKSLGYNNKEIHKKYLIILYVLMVLLYLVSVPVTDYLLNYLLKQIMDSIGFKLVVDLQVWNVLIGVSVLHLIFGLVTYYATRYYESIQVASLLKYNQK